MDIFNATAVALSLLVASPQVHQLFENAPHGAFESIPLGAVCGPTATLPDMLAGLEIPEYIVETVELDSNVRLHLSLAPSNHTSYTVIAEFIAEKMSCVIEVQKDEGRGA